VRYYGAENVDGQLHIFQEWVAGGSITGMLAKFGAFSLAVVRNYLSQALEGLNYLHDHKIMHRDIKGANILVSDGGIVKLADFGASKQILSEVMLSHTMRGTPYFMAPEVFEETYNFKADIWSIGCVAFQMFTANPPWKNLGTTNPVALFNKVKSHNGPPPVDVPASCTDKGSDIARFRALLERSFQFDPTKRPSAKEMLDDSFFMHTDSCLDDEHSVSYSLFSPCSTGSWGRLSSPCPATSRRGVSRGSSSCPPRSPFLSPPLPKRSGSPQISPKPDVTEWPVWARKQQEQACSPTLIQYDAGDKLLGSLAYSAATTAVTEVCTAPDLSLAGLNYV
jgi:serine/threonine protein kinase